jgi:hypothetical protein
MFDTRGSGVPLGLDTKIAKTTPCKVGWVPASFEGLEGALMALAVLAYNLTRVMNIVGIKPLIAAIAA